MTPPLNEVVPTSGFVITSTIIGDKSVTLKWSYGGIDETKIIKLMVFMNDTTVTNPTTPNNLSWTATYVDYSAISLKTTTISNLIEGENMLFYLAIITNEDNVIHTKYSLLSEPILIVSAPNPFTLPIEDGRDLVTIGSYKLKVRYFGTTRPNQDKIVFILLNSAQSPGHSIYEFEADTNYTLSTNSTYFTLTNLSSDVTYEVSGFLIKDGLISTLSDTRWIIATQKTGPPTKPSMVFDYPSGTVALQTDITYDGVHTTVLMKLYSSTNLSEPLGSEDITTALYGADLLLNNTPYTYTKTYSNSVLTYAQKYNVVYITNTLNIGNSIYNSNLVSNNLYLLKTPEPPLIRSCDSGDKYVKLSWSNGELYNSTVSKYQLSIDNNDSSPQDITDRFTLGYKSSNNITGLTNGQTYSLKIRTVVPDLNDSGAFIYSAWSVPQIATPYVNASALELNINYDIENVDKKAMLSWSIPSIGASTGYLAIDHFEIQKSIDNGSNYSFLSNVVSNQNNYVDNSLINGNKYLYKIRIITKTINYQTVIDVFGADSNQKSIVPWSIPSAPTIVLDETVYAAQGNHYIKIKIFDNTVTGNGLNLVDSANLPQYEIYLDSTKYATVSANNLVSTLYKINNLVNAQVYKITVKGLYKNQNIIGTPIYNSTVASNELTAAPVYTNTLFAPRDLLITDVASNTVKISWTAPELMATLSTYNLSFKNYEIHILDSAYNAVLEPITTSNLTETYTNTLLVNGVTYSARVYAVYDGDINESGDQIKHSSPISGAFIPFEIYQVNNYKLVSVSSGSAVLTWDLDNGLKNSGNRYFTYYRIHIYRNSSHIATTDLTVAQFTVYSSLHTINNLSNGQVYTAKVSPMFLNPNTGTISFSFSNAVPFTAYTIPSALVLSQTLLDNDSVNLSWSAQNISGLAFKYILSQRDSAVGSSPTENEVAQTDTVYIANNLSLGHEYEFKIKVRFSDPNMLIGTSPNYYVYNDFSSLLKVTPFAQPTVGTLTGEAGNELVDLIFSLDEDSIIGGLNVIEYGYKYRVSTTSNLTEGFTYVGVGQNPNTQIRHNDLTNGQLYDFVYVVNTDNSVNPAEYQSILTSFNSALISLKPFTNPDAPINVAADTASGQNVILTWGAPANLGGMELYGYDIYENNTLVEENHSSTSTSHTFQSRTYGQTYTYYVVAKTQNSNLSGIALVSSASSSTATKIVFEAPNAVTGLEVVSVNDDSPDTIVFRSTHTNSIGLLSIKFRIYYSASILGAVVSKSVDISVADEVYNSITGLYSYSITDFTGSITYNATVYIVGTNPNNSLDILESSKSSISFGSFDEPVLHEFYVTELGDRYISVTIDSLNLNFTNFVKYRLEFYTSGTSTLVGTNYFDAMSVINTKITNFDVWDNTLHPHGVLQNNATYMIKAYAMVTNPVDGLAIESVANIISSVTPLDNSVPVVSTIDLSSYNGVLQANIAIDSKGMDILGYMLVIIPSGNIDASPSDLFYNSTAVIPVLIADISTTIIVPLTFTLSNIGNIVVMVKNTNGWSEFKKLNN